jgi:hypothetical protein
MEERHSGDLYNVHETDEVTITTTTGNTFDATCVNFQNQHADPRSGEVVTTLIWRFQSPEFNSVIDIGITNGLKSSPDQDDFPRHHEVYLGIENLSLGYVETITIDKP